VFKSIYFLESFLSLLKFFIMDSSNSNLFGKMFAKVVSIFLI
jgi:hypothetical protein